MSKVLYRIFLGDLICHFDKYVNVSVTSRKGITTSGIGALLCHFVLKRYTCLIMRYDVVAKDRICKYSLPIWLAQLRIRLTASILTECGMIHSSDQYIFLKLKPLGM